MTFEQACDYVKKRDKETDALNEENAKSGRPWRVRLFPDWLSDPTYWVAKYKMELETNLIPIENVKLLRDEYSTISGYDFVVQQLDTIIHLHKAGNANL